MLSDKRINEIAFEYYYNTDTPPFLLDIQGAIKQALTESDGMLAKELEEAKQQNDILTVDIEMGLELLKEAEEELEQALKGEQVVGIIAVIDAHNEEYETVDPHWDGHAMTIPKQKQEKDNG